MRGQACCGLIYFLLLSAQSRAETACVDLAQLAHSTVSITRYFEEAERDPLSDVVAARGTAWFQSPTSIVTAAVQRVAGSYAEKLAVLELQTAVPNARSVAIRMVPLMPEDRVVTFAYPNDRLHTVVGRFVQYADTGRLAGTALLEIFEGENRLVIDYGASGAPVFDCEGRVAAVISTVITQILSTPFGNRRVSTGWGLPNVVSIPIQQLMEFSKAQ